MSECDGTCDADCFTERTCDDVLIETIRYLVKMNDDLLICLTLMGIAYTILLGVLIWVVFG